MIHLFNLKPLIYWLKIDNKSDKLKVGKILVLLDNWPIFHT